MCVPDPVKCLMHSQHLSRTLQVDNEVLEAAHELMRPLSLRRLKEHVETSLPPRVRWCCLRCVSQHTMQCITGSFSELDGSVITSF